ncbi:ABC transporter permease [Candidatus Woesebacteria bacterium]|nr:ABC transporter permease [Candidatus Woesebacteria bacterium]
MRISKLLLLPKAMLRINYLKLSKEVLFFLKFFVLVVLYLAFDFLRVFSNLWPMRVLLKPVRRPVKGIRDRLFWIFNTRDLGEIASLDLVLLAVRHLKAKKTRTIITIGGMSIGFGSVIFLLSLGYGTQRLVVSRVARLDEMQQVTVTAGQASSLKMNDETLESFAKLESVRSVLPMVSVVSKVNFNNSVSDVVAYGVSREFLEESAIQPTQGELFDDGEVAAEAPKQPKSEGQVAGAAIERRTDAKMYKQLSQVTYSVYPLVWKPVYAQPSDTAKIIGYTNRVPGAQDAAEVWGQSYSASSDVPVGVDLYGNEFSAWIQDSFPLWSLETCSAEDIDCADGKYKMLREAGAQQIEDGFIQEDSVVIDRYKIIPESRPTFAEGELVDQVQFSFGSNTYAQLYSAESSSAVQLNLFTSQLSTGQPYSGEMIFGESYQNSDGWGTVGQNEHGKQVGLWIRAKVPVWRKLDCSDCEQLFLTERDTQDRHVEALAVIRADSAIIDAMDEPPRFGSVLGDATESASVSLAPAATASDSAIEAELTEIDLGDGNKLAARTAEDGSVGWVSIASGSADTTEAREKIAFTATSKRQAVVNQAMLSVLGIGESEALGKTFSATLLLDQEFFDAEDYQAESESTEFSIIGVIPGDKNPAYYLPFSDIKGLGVQNYSQIKVVVTDQSALPDLRLAIESMGYKTTSVVDTVGKINDLFGTVRLLLSLLGMVALGVAALGMFNTLTVSLLEKTREVGLMKAIGMKSSEVKRLFLAESIVMGLSGGIFGIILSAIAGQGLSLALSMFSMTKGLGYISLVYTPVYLSAAIIAVAFLVGVLTGLYPSHRATKISALNALRYE